MKLAVLMKARDIPVGSFVTKRTGEKEYTVEDRIRVFPTGDGPSQEIKAEGGARFLANGRGDFNVVDPKTELLWRTDDVTLYNFLRHRVEGPDQ